MFFQFFEEVNIDNEISIFGKLFICHKGSMTCTDALLSYRNVVFLKQGVECLV